MGYTKEVLERARQSLAQQRTDAESQTAARLQQAYAQVPRLREIDRDLRLTMAKAAQTVFVNGGDAKKALELAVSKAGDDRVIIIFGSLSTISTICDILKS